MNPSLCNCSLKLFFESVLSQPTDPTDQLVLRNASLRHMSSAAGSCGSFSPKDKVHPARQVSSGHAQKWSALECWFRVITPLQFSRVLFVYSVSEGHQLAIIILLSNICHIHSRILTHASATQQNHFASSNQTLFLYSPRFFPNEKKPWNLRIPPLTSKSASDPVQDTVKVYFFPFSKWRSPLWAIPWRPPIVALSLLPRLWGGKNGLFGCNPINQNMDGHAYFMILPHAWLFYS